jgi:CBS domain-containing protein
MRVHDLLKKKPRPEAITIEPDTNVGTAARLLMTRNIGGLPVVRRDGSLEGFVAERQIVAALDASDEDIRRLPVRGIMRRPAPTCTGDATLQEVMAIMTRGRLRHLVVVDDDGIAGVLSVGDLVKHRLEQLETETAVLRDYVVAQRAKG